MVVVFDRAGYFLAIGKLDTDRDRRLDQMAEVSYLFKSLLGSAIP